MQVILDNQTDVGTEKQANAVRMTVRDGFIRLEHINEGGGLLSWVEVDAEQHREVVSILANDAVRQREQTDVKTPG